MNPKLIRITTVPLSLHLLINGQPKYMQKQGFDIKLASATGKEISQIEKETGLKIKILPLTRKISPITDIKALWQTYKYFRKEKPQIIHTHTPKAGVVGMLAAKMAKVPIRMHTVAGLPLMETKGLKRKMLNIVEKITSKSSTNIYPNSFAIKEVMIKNKLASTNKLKVIGNGSSNGLDSNYFSKNKLLAGNLIRLKKKLKIKTNDVVFCFVGRIVKDKGINELLWAFDKLSKENKQVKLLLVGHEEKELDPIDEKSQRTLDENRQIISVGWQDDVRPFLAISDVFVFPSYREGFPNVVMQAGAMGLPSIVTDINGSNEIIENRVNGLIITPKDKTSLFKKMELLTINKKLRERLAKPARQMIMDRFEQKFVWKELLKEYVRLLDEKGIEHNLELL
jgi:glycosyltransferase involved in cell wall biosynthesis